MFHLNTNKVSHCPHIIHLRTNQVSNYPHMFSPTPTMGPVKYERLFCFFSFIYKLILLFLKLFNESPVYDLVNDFYVTFLFDEERRLLLKMLMQISNRPMIFKPGNFNCLRQIWAILSVSVPFADMLASDTKYRYQ